MLGQLEVAQAAGILSAAASGLPGPLKLIALPIDLIAGGIISSAAKKKAQKLRKEARAAAFAAAMGPYLGPADLSNNLGRGLAREIFFGILKIKPTRVFQKLPTDTDPFNLIGRVVELVDILIAIYAIANEKGIPVSVLEDEIKKTDQGWRKLLAEASQSMDSPVNPSIRILKTTLTTPEQFLPLLKNFRRFVISFAEKVQAWKSPQLRAAISEKLKTAQRIQRLEQAVLQPVSGGGGGELVPVTRDGITTLVRVPEKPESNLLKFAALGLGAFVLFKIIK